MNRTNGNSLTRREWLATNSAAMLVGVPLLRGRGRRSFANAESAILYESSARRIDASAWESLAQRAVDAAMAAGAQYADARLTRTVMHLYEPQNEHGWENRCLIHNYEHVGIGVRAFVNGYWGFAAIPEITAETLVQVARDATTQAKLNARGPKRPAELGKYPVVQGRWETPVKIDPFSITIEEKNDLIGSWELLVDQLGIGFDPFSHLTFARQECAVATSEGSHFTQTLFESGGHMSCSNAYAGSSVEVTGIIPAGKGWELVLDAKIDEQLIAMPPICMEHARLAANARPALIGRYTLVCDGTTMGALVDQTIGVATQLDRALGYEANAGGSSYLNDPLAMLGQFSVASPMVNVTANRSVPEQCATVKWDAEGVSPQPFTLVKDGILTDFQTTREQAAWIAPYYQQHGRPVASNGCAASEDALSITMQHTPNLAMTPQGNATIDDLIASVETGILITTGDAQTDFQARNGLIVGERQQFRQITNGRLGRLLVGAVVQFNTQDLWKNVVAVGGTATQQTYVSSQYPFGVQMLPKNRKGQPSQITSHTVTAPAATITRQAIIDPSRKA